MTLNPIELPPDSWRKTFQPFRMTFHDLRNGYIFMVNPNGARRDELISNNVKRNVNWDGVWQARCRVDQEGWKVEMAIPFKTLSFNPNNSTWGFNITRSISRITERGRWTGARPEIRSSNVSEAGDITGLKGMQQGVGIEFTPYTTGRYTKSREPSDRDRSGEFGADLRYRITPNLSATLSYNTDFAETEVDQRQINLTRFPLFFPEKRAFFLEDSGIYEFGGLESGISLRSRSVFRNPLIPYFTRRIGLSDEGKIVPILTAGKLAGRVGKYNIGFTDALLEENGDLRAQNVFSGRVSRNVLEQSSVGIISTFGDPNSNDDNFLIGPDFQFRTTKFMGNRILEANAFALGSYTENADTELAQAYGGNISYPNDLVRAQLEFMEIDDDFNPSLGYVRRKGIRAYGSLWSYRPRPESIDWARQFQFTYSNQVYTELSNEIDSQQHDFYPFRVEFESSDELFFRIRRSHDSPNDDFEIIDDVVIRNGDYWWTDYGIGLDLAAYRMISGRMEVSAGDFYDGDRQQFRSSFQFLPWKHLNFILDYEYNHIDLPEDEFHTHIASFRMIWNFTPDLFWSHFLQFDNLSDSVGLNSRLQWEYLPGSRLFFVVNQGYKRENSSLRVMNSEIALKIGARYRF